MVQAVQKYLEAPQSLINFQYLLKIDYFFQLSYLSHRFFLLPRNPERVKNFKEKCWYENLKWQIQYGS